MSDADVPVPYFHVVFFILLLIIYAFSSAIEVSVIYINKIGTTNFSKDEENNPKISDIIENAYYIKALQYLKMFILVFATMDISINILPNLYGCFSTFFFGEAVRSGEQNPSTLILIVQLVFSFLLTFAVLGFCDNIPKKIAMLNDEKISYLRYRFINLLVWIFVPITKFMTNLVDFIIKLAKADAKELDEKVSEEEIKALVETASERGVFNDLEKNVINSIFSFDDITAKDIMVSRKDTYKININDPVESYLDEAIDTCYSRIPVYRDNIDDIVGILNMKNLLASVRKSGFDNIDINSIIQEPYFVPEMKNLDELFKEMQKNHSHMAILVDEYGGFSGIVTIEDLIEEIMGEISDETDSEDELDIKKLSDNVYKILGKTELRDINKELGTNLESENCDTISALMIEKLGYIPTMNQKPTVEIDNLTLHVDVAEDNRINILTLTIQPIHEDLETHE